MTIQINTRAKSDSPATYQQSQFLIKNATLENIAIPSANARITKCMDYEDADNAVRAIKRGEEVTLQFN